MTNTAFWVAGVPVQQGSMKAFVAGGKARVVHTNPTGLNAWRDAIATEARARFTTVTEGKVEVDFIFVLPRPKSHPKRIALDHIKAPDIDKLARAGLDAMTGIAYRDDRQVASLRAAKRYAVPDEQTGVKVLVWRDE